MPKKQAAPNAFFLFMQDMQRSQGKKFRPMGEISQEAGVRWQKMSKAQKAPYEEKAQLLKGQSKPSKLTSDGKDVELIEKQITENEKAIQTMRENIEANMLISEKYQRLESDVYYIIHVNIFCICQSSERVYPAEIGIAGFSLKDGVNKDVFHSEILPGKLPLGYSAKAKLLSDETHQYNCLSLSFKDDNQETVFLKMLQFLLERKEGSSRGNFDLPILYAPEKIMDMVKQLLEQWCYDFGHPLDTFHVYSLENMFRSLKNHCAGENVWASDTFSSREIEKDTYCYSPDIACEFHGVSDLVAHCSRSIVVRYGYTICDNCAPSRDIDLVPGFHVPMNSKVDGPAWTTSKSRGRSASKSNTNPSRTVSTYDSDSERADYSDGETVSTLGKSNVWGKSSVNSSVNFGALDSEIPERYDADDDSWSDNLSIPDFGSQTSDLKCNEPASSGFGRRPGPLPHQDLTPNISSLNIGSNPNNFPPLGKSARGRGQAVRNYMANMSARGRGTKFN